MVEPNGYQRRWRSHLGEHGRGIQRCIKGQRRSRHHRHHSDPVPEVRSIVDPERSLSGRRQG